LGWLCCWLRINAKAEREAAAQAGPSQAQASALQLNTTA
jgi:hypothetical protein